jgi:ParB/RepB/Spo0J family partition protein
MDFGLYCSRWEHKPRKTTLSDFIARQGKSSAKKERTLMEKSEFSLIDLREKRVKPNPNNPRGKRQDYDQEDLEKLSKDIDCVGLIHPIVLMKTGKENYMILEGHRRFYAMQMIGLEKFEALVLPRLSREQQLLIMYDSDIFEEVNRHDTLMGIARQYELSKKAKPAMTITEFCNQQARWRPKIVRDAISYYHLTPEVREMCQRGLISYGVGVLIGKLEDKVSQKDFAESAAVLRQSMREVNRILNADANQGTIWSKEQHEQMKKEGQKRTMIENLEGLLSGVCYRTNKKRFMDADAKKLVQDYYLCHRFQKFFRILQEAVNSFDGSD